MKTLYPWQQSDYASLFARYQQDKLPHALLLSGLAGLGKAHLARVLSQAMLCKQPSAEGVACNKCSSCELVNAGTHPDLYIVNPLDKDKKKKREYSEKVKLEEFKKIGIDQNRSLINFLSLKSHSGGHKIVLVYPADYMTRDAANSLLKNLEEPAGDTLIMLVTDRPGYLLPTIRSRCQTISFGKPVAVEVLPWLEQQFKNSETGLNPELARDYLGLARGAPLKAVLLAENQQLEQQNLLIKQLTELTQGQQDPVSLAQNWVKSGVPQSLDWMAAWVADVIKLKFVSDFPLSNNRNIYQLMQGLAQKTEVTALFRFLDRLNKSARLAEGSINQQLLLEDAMICWSRLFRNR